VAGIATPAEPDNTCKGLWAVIGSRLRASAFRGMSRRDVRWIMAL